MVFSAVAWAYKDVITSAKLAAMVENTRAHDHRADGSQGAASPAVTLTDTVAEVVVTNTLTALLWNVEESDVSGMHAAAPNPERITVPAGAGGIYLVTASASWASNATGRRLLVLRKNGVEIDRVEHGVIVTTAVTVNESIATQVALAAGDYLEVYVLHTAGANLNVTGNRFTATLVART